MDGIRVAVEKTDLELARRESGGWAVSGQTTLQGQVQQQRGVEQHQQQDWIHACLFSVAKGGQGEVLQQGGLMRQDPVKKHCQNRHTHLVIINLWCA